MRLHRPTPTRALITALPMEVTAVVTALLVPRNISYAMPVGRACYCAPVFCLTPPEGMRKIAERWSVPGGRPKVSNCKLSGPMATSAAAGARQILKTGLIVAWLGLVGLA